MKPDLTLTFCGRRLTGPTAEDATIYHSDQWLSALASYYGYRAAPELLEAAGEVVAYAPLVEIGNLTGKKLRSPPASMYGHLLANTHEHQVALVECLKERSRQAQQRLLLKVAGDDELPLAELSREIDCRIPLSDEETVWNNLHSSARRGVRKSQREGVVVATESLESLGTFFNLLVATRKRLGLPVAPRKWARHTLDCGRGGLLIARKEGAAVAGILFLQDENYVHYALPAYSDAGTKVHAMDACIWALIENACASGHQWLGMGGSPVQNEGLRRFKTKWGGEERIMRLLSDVPSTNAVSRRPATTSTLLRYAPAFVLEALGYLYLRFLQ